jgi:5'-3' exonuclease
MKNMEQVVRKSVAKANNIDASNKTYHLLVDGNSVLKSSLVNKGDVNEKGEEYGAIVTFLYRIGNILALRDFNHCVVCWDGFNSGVLRWEIYKDYKANRDKNYEAASILSNPQSEYDRNLAIYCKKVIEYHKMKEQPVKRGETDDENFQRQRDILQEILDELFVRQYMYDNVEGDDLIAYYCQHKQKNDYIVIVSEDRDLSQLIREDICLYIPSIKKFVSPKNDREVLGIPYYNVVFKKIICGDTSDNIKGVKGIGEKTLEKYYPKILTEKASLSDFIDTCKQIQSTRKGSKKKPVQCLENAIGGVTDGCQGDKLYEINEKIIDLSTPMLTEEAKSELIEIHNAPIDPDERGIKHVYEILSENKMERLLNDYAFGQLFGLYERIRKKEIEFGKK